MSTAACIIADLNRIAGREDRGTAEAAPGVVGATAESSAAAEAAAAEPASVRLEIAQQKLWAAIMADAPDLPAIAVRLRHTSQLSALLSN